MTPAAMHAAIRERLVAHAEPEKLPLMQRFFKEPIDAYCTYTQYVRAVAKEHGAEFGAWTQRERMALTKALWGSGKHEEGSVAILLYARMARRLGRAEWDILSKWLEREVRNWAHCDTLCAEVLGPMLIRNPEWVGEMRQWAAAKPLYKRRAALVAPLKGLRKGMFRAELEELMGMLAADRDAMVKKGIVWVRRELAR